jgi:cystathionine gamma-synthase
MERGQSSALKIAGLLLRESVVEAVYYPGLETHPGYELSRKQASGFGSMLSFKVKNRESAERVLERVKLIKYAESLGGAESLITYPMLQTHADIPEAERSAKGIDDRLIRLSVGLESSDDLIRDLQQAL